MDDKTIMSTILGNVKGCCDLMMHGSIESSTPNVHSTFTSHSNRQSNRKSLPQSKSLCQTSNRQRGKIFAPTYLLVIKSVL